MIFTARGIVVSLAFFAVVYCPLSCAMVLTWWAMRRMRRKHVVTSARFLFGLRMFSFTVSTLVVVFFTFPSFWLMERASLDEDGRTFILAACGLLIVSAGLVRVFSAHAKTKRAVTLWLSKTPNNGSDTKAATPALSAANGAPPLILVGIRRPRVMVSDAAATVLSDGELQVAIRHELGHVRSWDNLKKLLINATPFPGMSSLETAWREAAELAADDAAVENRQDALDLAAALIKLSRGSKQPWVEPALASGLVCGSSSISLRVERLLEWRTAGHGFQRTRPWALLVLFTMLIGIASNYGATLVLAHRLTEFLVP
ncbi:MAG: M56 family metallopeptidase [Candidatus Korobacteraceae bacterium]|jgi:Zn-dependent protease with chaperone function